MGKRIKNIIFDLGGVLVNLDKQRCVDAFCHIGAKDISKYVDECRQEDLFHELEMGMINTHQFCDEVRRISGAAVTDQAICEAWNALIVDMPEKRKEKVASLTGEYRLFLLSNTNEIHWEKCVGQLFSYNGGNIAKDCFEKCFLSYEMHQVKPSMEIFSQVVNEACINAEETLFLDDSAANCSAAESMGIKTMLVGKEDWTENINRYKI